MDKPLKPPKWQIRRSNLYRTRPKGCIPKTVMMVCGMTFDNTKIEVRPLVISVDGIMEAYRKDAAGFKKTNKKVIISA
ncbi:hypothetical protein HMSSN036_65780 [Paenibacillus macerans]|nr:hypothetical protein HMSSN036_65780 [Paenibacillus macerans]